MIQKSTLRLKDGLFLRLNSVAKRVGIPRNRLIAISLERALNDIDEGTFTLPPAVQAIDEHDRDHD